MAANVDPYRRYRPIRLGIHVFATDDQSGESITVRNYDLPSPELARLRFEAARLACLRPADDDSPELVVELISGGKILDAFPMRRVTLPRLSVIIDPPPPPAAAIVSICMLLVALSMALSVSSAEPPRLKMPSGSMTIRPPSFGDASWCYEAVSL